MAAPMAAPMAGGVIYGGAAASDGVIMESPAAAPAPAASATEAVIEEAPAASDAVDTPAVDPSAFMIRNGNVRG